MADATRWLAAGAATAAYGAMCAGIWWRGRRRAAAAASDADALAAGSGAVLMVHASQTGQAEVLAWQSARWLHDGGTAVRVLPLNAVDAPTLQQAHTAYFIASTYGEGDPPDGASVFVERLMGGAQALRLPALRYAVLALGDRQYANFCGFGRSLDAWLAGTGAVPAFERVDVDNNDATAWEEWQRRLRPDAAPVAGPPADDTPFAPWRLVGREHLNPGSEGAPIHLLHFLPPPGPDPVWASGDLVQVALADDPARPRDYSIASTVHDGELQLIVRQELHPDGRLGAASGLLTQTLAPGDTVPMRIRVHPAFRLADHADWPLLLIGNGTGLAGLRAHLRERAAMGVEAPAWLVFGERHAAHDFLCRDELEAWHASGRLARLDMVFSRDAATRHGERRYVQHRLLECADEVAAWVNRGAAIYVCGSLQGMASGVDAALRQVLGDARLGELMAAGRYRRDVY